MTTTQDLIKYGLIIFIIGVLVGAFFVWSTYESVNYKEERFKEEFDNGYKIGYEDCVMGKTPVYLIKDECDG